MILVLGFSLACKWRQDWGGRAMALGKGAEGGSGGDTGNVMGRLS